MEVLSRRPQRDMVEPKPVGNIVIRNLETIEDLRKIEPVEKEVWGLAERDSAPMTLLIAHKEAGAILIGAFDGDKLLGFAFGFLALEHGHLFVHSHMLAVLPKYRDLDLGYKLKLAQRDRALGLGIKQMTWTFDPLQSRNAHFNFAKLGVVSDRYKVDFYGRDSSSVLHQNGTDRLWVTWPLASRRVQQRLQTGQRQVFDLSPVVPPLVSFNGDGRPARSDLASALSRQRICIEIPGDILEVESRDQALAWEWRLATRWAFTESLKAGFFVAEYFRNIRGQQGPGIYLLQRGKMSEFVPEF
jgi:predicted GNAT superfamily acetyltransferase